MPESSNSMSIITVFINVCSSTCLVPCMFSMSARLLSIYHYLDDSKNLQTDLNQNNQVDVFSFHKEEGML